MRERDATARRAAAHGGLSWRTAKADGQANPWRLQPWLGHKRIDKTMLYVHVAEAHHRELPEIAREKARAIDDPDQRVLAMLGARACLELTQVRGSGVAVAEGPERKKPATSAG